MKEVSVLLCLLCSTFFSPVTASRLVNSECTLTLDRHFSGIWPLYVLKPLRIFRQHGDCPPEVKQFTARSLLPVLWSLGHPRRAQAVYGPVGATLCWNQSVCRIDVCFTQLWKPWPHAAMTETLTHLYGLRTVISQVKRGFKSREYRFHTLLGFTVCVRLCDIPLITNGNFNTKHAGFPWSWKS